MLTLDTHTHKVTLANKSIKILLHNKVGSGSVKIKQMLRYQIGM